jgi:flagellar motility protein MotE (MotC chaperone)
MTRRSLTGILCAVCAAMLLNGEPAQGQGNGAPGPDQLTRGNDTAAQMAVRMMAEVRKREQEIAVREAELRRGEERLKALEAELSRLLAEISRRQEALEARGQHGAKEEEGRLSQLAKLVEGSNAEQGARLLSQLEPHTAARLLARMNSRKAGKFLASVEPGQAALISNALLQPRP